jgi:hypothetical protein
MRSPGIVLLAVAVLALAACSDNPTPPPTYSCDQSQVAGFSTCVEHGPLDEYGMNYSQWLCTQGGGTWGTTPCPAANRIASCKMGAYMGYGTQYYYGGFTGDLAFVASQCTMYGGTWTTYAP